VEVARDFEREAAARGGTLRHALTKAAKYCINNNILSKLLQEHSTEVRRMSLMNWTIEDEKAYCRAEGQNQVLELLGKKVSPQIVANIIEELEQQTYPKTASNK
jgi:hypothetical protein